MTEEMEPQKLHADEVSEEGKIPKEPYQHPHNKEARTLAQPNT